MATKFDTYIDEQLRTILQPGEQPLYRAYVTKQPGLFWQLILLGGLLLFLMTKAYFAVLTNRRLILIRTSMGLFGPGMANNGLEEIPLHQVERVTTSGFLNNRSITFHKAGGERETVRIAPWFKFVEGQKAFLEEMPERVNTKQLPAG
jgi:hypothetical protein